MGTLALNATYKHGIVALEASVVTSNVTAGDSTIAVSGRYMTDTPFVAGQTYVIMDNTFSGSVPNAERFMVVTATIIATPASDGIGYDCVGSLSVLGNNASGYVTTLNGSYSTTAGAIVLTPGVEVVPQSSDFNCRFKTISDSPKIDFDDESSRFATGDEGRDLSIAGARSAEISFTQKMAWAGAVATIPTWAKIMQICGHVVHPYTTKGIGFIPSTYANEITATIWVVNDENGMGPSSTIYRYIGAHGGNGCSIGCSKIGDVYTMTMKINAVFKDTLSTTTNKLRVLTSPDTQCPEVMLNNSVTLPVISGKKAVGTFASVTALVSGLALAVGSKFYASADAYDTTDDALATAKGSAVKVGDVFTVASSSTCTYTGNIGTLEISSWSLDMGGIVNPFLDQGSTTGNAYYATTDRDPKITINPYMVAKYNDDIDFMVQNNIVGKLIIKSAPTSPHITIEIPRAQCMSPSIASREGFSNTNRTYRCLRNSDGVTTSESALPVDAMYEILIGARS